MITPLLSFSSCLYEGLYLPTSGTMVLLAWHYNHLSLDIVLNETETFFLNSGSFRNSIGDLYVNCWSELFSVANGLCFKASF